MNDKVLVWFFFSVFIVIDETTCDSVKAANNYLDSVLDTKLRTNDQVQSFKLADFTTESRDRVLFITSRVKTSYYKGVLYNLENAARLGDCLPHTTSAVNSIECTIQFKHLRAEYQASLKYGRLPKMSIKAKAIMKPIDAKIEVETRAPKNTPELTRFQVFTPIDVDVSYKGLGLLNRYLRILKDDFVDKLKYHLRDTINRDYKDILQRSISRTEMKL